MGGASASTLARITILENELAELKSDVGLVKDSKATAADYGLAKICPVDVTDATQDSGLVCGAWEKDATFEGSLANKIQKGKVIYSGLTHDSKIELAVPTDVLVMVVANIAVLNHKSGAWIMTANDRTVYGLSEICPATNISASIEETNFILTKLSEGGIKYSMIRLN